MEEGKEIQTPRQVMGGKEGENQPHFMVGLRTEREYSLRQDRCKGGREGRWEKQTSETGDVRRRREKKTSLTLEQV